MNAIKTELDIITGLSAGDRNAWVALCEQYGHRVWRYVARLVGPDEEVVSDVYQESMLGVVKSGRNLDVTNTKLWPWLAGIAHRQLALYWRRRYQRTATDATQGNIVDEQMESPDELLQRMETVHQVRVLLADMPSEYVLLLIAKYVDGLTIQAMVEQYGGTTEGIRSKLARARYDFRRRVESTDQIELLR